MNKKNSWQPEQDDIVLVSILDAIQHHYSKEKAFVLASEKLALLDVHRTPGAIKAHWQQEIAKTSNAIELMEMATAASLQRPIENDKVSPAIELPPIAAETPLESPLDDLNSLVNRIEQYQQRIDKLELLNRQQKTRIKELESIEADYREMCAIMVKARKLMLDDEPSTQSNRYQIDQSGSITFEY